MPPVFAGGRITLVNSHLENAVIACATATGVADGHRPPAFLAFYVCFLCGSNERPRLVAFCGFCDSIQGLRLQDDELSKLGNGRTGELAFRLFHFFAVLASPNEELIFRVAERF